MRIDETRQNRRLAEVDHLRPGWNLHLIFRSHVCDPLALNDHNLAVEHLTALAVEQSSSADRLDLCRRRAFEDTFVRSDARCRPGAAPRSRRGLNLAKENNCDR